MNDSSCWAALAAASTDDGGNNMNYRSCSKDKS